MEISFEVSNMIYFMLSTKHLKKLLAKVPLLWVIVLNWLYDIAEATQDKAIKNILSLQNCSSGIALDRIERMLACS